MSDIVNGAQALTPSTLAYNGWDEGTIVTMVARIMVAMKGKRGGFIVT